MMNIKPYNPRDWRSHPPYSFKAYGSSVKRGPLKKLVPIKQTSVGDHRAVVQRYQTGAGRERSHA